MKTGVIVFPGSNCDKDIADTLKVHYSHDVRLLWHKDSITEKFDLIVVPGGFSYGDYLRSGAIARFSNAMKSLPEHISKGGKVLGICNGFQILTEARLLPGALLRNLNQKHICKTVALKAGNSKLLSGVDSILKIPISHGEGRYFADSDTLKQLEEKNRILVKYAYDNPNGSVNDIAGIISEDGKVVGLMPHPERAIESFAESRDGKKFFDTLFQNF
ncbi:MAG: phosphoribosylformylglycinamidine synthase subunit PurQ [Leptospiraceae bacterium]|nr:phosphoribosylformylglycinamidine synthase subunit PurQ [Leptospiraceae bacterium]